MAKFLEKFQVYGVRKVRIMKAFPLIQPELTGISLKETLGEYEHLAERR
jgi:hypothetical protein